MDGDSGLLTVARLLVGGVVFLSSYLPRLGLPKVGILWLVGRAGSSHYKA